MKRTKTQKGITLVALIITIIVLLILAVVAIRAVKGEGIIAQGKNARSKYTQGRQKELTILGSYLTDIEGSFAISVKEAQGKVLSETSNTNVVDEYGNVIKVPAGFKITTDANLVTEGIVIEDVSAGNSDTAGSQFVWIPVGRVYTNKEKTESKTITLGRYTFNEDGTINTELSKTEPEQKLKQFSNSTYPWVEGLKDDQTPNVHAKDIQEFRTSATNNRGYYIGRYEARDRQAISKRTKESATNNPVVINSQYYIYNEVSQSEAASLSQNMYQNEGLFISDLMNSYAWNTAILFLQEFDNRVDQTIPYSRQTSLNYEEIAPKGTEIDVICNIYDMASNCSEYTTETLVDYPEWCVGFVGSNFRRFYTSNRNYAVKKDGKGTLSFRPIMYLK